GIEKINRKQIIICGIEAHICVLQTAEELINCGYEVYLLKDCSASRRKDDFETAVEYMKQTGVKIINKEIALFMLLKSARHQKFRELQALIK
nr:isochorismatase family protein [Candidatus Gastranaerophilales bacterium]